MVFLKCHRKQKENIVSPEQIMEQLKPLEVQSKIHSISKISQLSQKKKKKHKIINNLKQIYILLKHVVVIEKQMLVISLAGTHCNIQICLHSLIIQKGNCSSLLLPL